jgi:26S proteasome regulatory subunit N1
MAPKDKAVDITATSGPSGGGGGPNSKSSSKKKGDTQTTLPEDTTLSEEDRDLKERLETCVQTMIQTNSDDTIAAAAAATSLSLSSSWLPLQQQALQMLRTELRTATASMTSVPKPLKFLRPHYASLQTYYQSTLAVFVWPPAPPSTSSTSTSSTSISSSRDERIQQITFRAQYADVMAVLAMTMGAPDGR